MNFKQFFYQQELNEGKNITLPPEVLAAIDQHLPEIMSQICESKNTGKKFEMNLVEFNNKYIKKSNVENPEISRLNLIFKWDQMQKDPVIEEIKKQVDQLQTPQTPNQIIKIIIDPEKTETMTHAAGWANTEEIKTDYLELLFTLRTFKCSTFTLRTFKYYTFICNSPDNLQRNWRQK